MPPDHVLDPAECSALARAVASQIETADLDRSGPGRCELLWRNEHAEAWLNTWWEPRDTGFHDHGGACVGVHVLEGAASHEQLAVQGPRRIERHGAGESFALGRSGIHRMDHDAGAVTVHVYSPPLRVIGHYELVDGVLHRIEGAADAVSPPSPGLSAALSR